MEQLLHWLPEMQATLAVIIFFSTFAYEDGATLLAASLSATGRLDPRLGLLSAFLGIWVGDVGLYALGASFGRRAARSRILSRFVTPESLGRAEAWFAKRGTSALVMSRAIPGTRLPLYVAAGALKMPVRVFTTVTGVCSAIWVMAIFTVWHFFPQSVHNSRTQWMLAAVVLTAPWLVGKLISQSRFRTLIRKYRRWEFWPAWLFYPPVAAMCAWLGVKYRGFSLPTIANPSFRNGGIVGESKIDILQALHAVAPESVAQAFLLARGNSADRIAQLASAVERGELSYPFVLKPNVGQRGAGFKLVHSPDEANRYLAQVDSDVIAQSYVAGPKEIGVFYYRFPGSQRGAIFAITRKSFPSVVGDGVRTFDELLRDDERASLIAATYLARFPELVGRVLPAGERIRLVEAGNHCQGCIFLDGEDLISEPLRVRIDAISQSLPGFFIGRYDLRYANDEDLIEGRNFQIIELNGAASEATNIYDAKNSLLSAYRTLYRQWELVYAIGRANRDRGHRPATASDVLRDLLAYRRISAAYPAAD
jgi:membrane protein DedA with SNARE-associated domain